MLKPIAAVLVQLHQVNLVIQLNRVIQMNQMIQMNQEEKLLSTAQSLEEQTTHLTIFHKSTLASLFWRLWSSAFA